MKRILAATAALAAVAVCGSAYAQSAQGTLNITATVSKACAAGSFSTLALGNIIDTSTGLLNASAVNVASSPSTNFWCNGTASTVQLTANPIKSPTAGNSSFDNQVDYTVTASGIGTATGANAATATTTTNAGVGTAANAGLFDTPVTLTLSAANVVSGKKLVAGTNYTGSVVVTVTSN